MKKNHVWMIEEKFGRWWIPTRLSHPVRWAARIDAKNMRTHSHEVRIRKYIQEKS